MAAASFVNPPSVHGISQDAAEAVNGQTWIAAELLEEAPPPAENMTKIPSDLKEMPNKENLEIIKEKNGWVSAGLPHDVVVRQSSTETARAAARALGIPLLLLTPWETLAKKAVILGNASITKMEALPGDIKGVGFVVCFPAGVFKEHDLKPVFDNQNRKLVIELEITDQERKLILEKLEMEKIAKEVGEFPEDVKVNVSGISWTWMEDGDGVLTVLVPIDHQKPEKKTRPIVKFIKAALAKALAGCTCVALKEFVDEMNDDFAV